MNRQKRGIHVLDFNRHSSRLRSNGKYNFEYDGNGNLIKKSTGSGDVVWEYRYDLLNRLVKVDKNGQTIVDYLYDESGLRIQKTGADGIVNYVFDTAGNLLYEQENRDYLEYIYVLGKHFARIDGNLDNSITKKYFYHTDHLGSTVAVTDETGQQVWSAEYTPFGGEHSTEGELDRAAKFTGKDLDEDTGLYYFNARWYDGEVGRFVSEDPAQDGNNWYIYGVNNPLINTDPTGMMHQNDSGDWGYDDWDYEWNNDYDCYNFWVYNDDFFSYGSHGGWWNDTAKLDAAWDFLGVLDFDSGNWVKAGGYYIPYYESRRVQTIQGEMGIDVTGWYDDQTKIATGTLQEIYRVNNARSSVFGLNTWRAMESISNSQDRFWKYHEFYQEYRGNLAGARRNDLVADILVNAAIFGGGKAVLSRLVPEAVTVVSEATSTLKTTALVPYQQWPNRGGFLGGYTTETFTTEGQILSRIGGLDGSYVSPEGTSFGFRGLPSTYPNRAETLWRVVKPFNMKAGVVAPWKDSAGLGIQYVLPDSIINLWKQGFIEPIF